MASFLRLSSSATHSTSPFNLFSRAFASKKTTAVISLKTRPKTSWQLFLNDHKDRFMDENGRYKLIEAAKALSVEWKQMTDAQKKPYIDRHLANTLEYENALKKISPLELAKESALHRRSNRILKDPDQPKRPVNAFFRYLEDIRKTSDEFKKLGPVKDQASRAGEMWRALSDDEKKKYKDQADKENKKYLEKMEQYKQA
ncbi:high mobility group box domain-containing protein [Endogone sp. FLAS-F59071]|nr:high mobility group box domain-containing protein [Endogone sp. FLAS-F59071]|eukprot:RUS17345.1 high mobility group box domain-containing protein [Endogone sp. FLAS-F59071]